MSVAECRAGGMGDVRRPRIVRVGAGVDRARRPAHHGRAAGVNDGAYAASQVSEGGDVVRVPCCCGAKKCRGLLPFDP